MSRVSVAFLLVTFVMLGRPGGSLVPGVGSAWAMDKAKARAAYRSGSQHYDLGEFAEALADFKEAYRNFEEPIFLFNIAQCHRQLGQIDLAIRFFRTYLAKAPTAQNRAAVEDTLDKLKVEQEKQAAASPIPPTATQAPPASVEPPANKPPEPSAVATPTPSVPAPALVTAAPTPEKRTPIYKRWWLWTAVGVVAAGVGTALAVVLTRPNEPSAPTSIGTVSPNFQ
jgi:tetratricopeptide (TPR) repeat protein